MGRLQSGRVKSNPIFLGSLLGPRPRPAAPVLAGKAVWAGALRRTDDGDSARNTDPAKVSGKRPCTRPRLGFDPRHFRRDARVAEGGGLLNRYRCNSLSGVRIPLSPPVFPYRNWPENAGGVGTLRQGRRSSPDTGMRCRCVVRKVFQKPAREPCRYGRPACVGRTRINPRRRRVDGAAPRGIRGPRAGRSRAGRKGAATHRRSGSAWRARRRNRPAPRSRAGAPWRR